MEKKKIKIKCCFCKETKNIEYHHPNYYFPLSVYPICRKHHTQIYHGNNGGVGKFA